MTNTNPAKERRLGPRQQSDAARQATHMNLWTLDLQAAIAANNVERATELAHVLRSTSDALLTTLGRAK